MIFLFKYCVIRVVICNCYTGIGKPIGAAKYKNTWVSPSIVWANILYCEPVGISIDNPLIKTGNEKTKPAAVNSAITAVLSCALLNA